MKHAGPGALESLAGLLARIRQQPVLAERRPGVFYLKSRAYLHFHEDPAGLFADLRQGAEWERFRVVTTAEQGALLSRLAKGLRDLA
jgi:hypothetical protein